LSYQSEGVISKITHYLFGKDESSDFLDMRTKVARFDGVNPKTIMFYRILEKKFECKTAKIIADTLERLAIAIEGRKEATEALRSQRFPKTEKILYSYESEEEEEAEEV